MVLPKRRITETSLLMLFGYFLAFPWTTKSIHFSNSIIYNNQCNNLQGIFEF